MVMKKLFKKYINSVLSPDEFSKLVNFLVEKRNNAEIFRTIKPVWDETMDAPDIAPRKNELLLGKIKAAVLKDKNRLAHKKLRLYKFSLAAAAVVLIALVFGNILFYERMTGQDHDKLQTVTTPFGGKTNITLPDGSQVWINSGSVITFPTKFGKCRNVTLVGEAYFQVEKTTKPFTVSTNYGDVEVKGTSFNVKAFADDSCFETTLTEGSVLLRHQKLSKEIILEPGQQAICTPTGFDVRQVDPKYFTSWKDGKLLFNREPFPSFIKKLERWYNVKIEYSDTGLTDLWYTGTIEMESISEVMEMISKAAPVTYSFNNKTREFIIKLK